MKQCVRAACSDTRLWDRLQIPAEEREAVATVMTESKAQGPESGKEP